MKDSVPRQYKIKLLFALPGTDILVQKSMVRVMNASQPDHLLRHVQPGDSEARFTFVPYQVIQELAGYGLLKSLVYLSNPV